MARRLFAPQLLQDSTGKPAASGPFRVYTDAQAGSEITDLRAADGVTALTKNGIYFLARADGNVPLTRGPDTGTGANETVMMWIDTGGGVRYEWHAADALQETILGRGTGGTGGLPAGTTLDSIGDGSFRFAMSSVQQTRVANSVQNAGGFARVWGRGSGQGFPTAAEGALDGDWLLVDGTP